MGMFGNAFKPGGAGRDIAGYVGDALLSVSGHNPIYTPMKAQERQQGLELQRQMALAQYKAQHPDPTGTMQNVEAAGLVPGTPEYQQFMQRAILAPRYIVTGDAQEGQDIHEVGGASPQLPSPKSEEDYNALPTGSQYMGSDGQVRIKG